MPHNLLRLRQEKEEHIMKIVTIGEAQTQLPALLDAVEATGEPVLICRQGTPVADLVPHRTRSRLAPHPLMQQIRIDYDPTEPLTADEWPEQHR
jgi:prevent-host-death family protein